MLLLVIWLLILILVLLIIISVLVSYSSVRLSPLISSTSALPFIILLVLVVESWSAFLPLIHISSLVELLPLYILLHRKILHWLWILHWFVLLFSSVLKSIKINLINITFFYYLNFYLIYLLYKVYQLSDIVDMFFISGWFKVILCLPEIYFDRFFALIERHWIIK